MILRLAVSVERRFATDGQTDKTDPTIANTHAIASIARVKTSTKLNINVKTYKLLPCGTDGRVFLSDFQALVTLTVTLDRVIRHTVVH